jgi:hypothetical protein
MAGTTRRTLTIKRTLSILVEVDDMLHRHVRSTPGASLSSVVNEALFDYLERQAMRNYEEWLAAAPPEERAWREALDADDARLDAELAAEWAAEQAAE